MLHLINYSLRLHFERQFSLFLTMSLTEKREMEQEFQVDLNMCTHFYKCQLEGNMFLFYTTSDNKVFEKSMNAAEYELEELRGKSIINFYNGLNFMLV